MKKTTLDPTFKERAENHRAVLNLLVYLLLALSLAIVSIVIYSTGATMDPVLLF